MSSSSIAPLFLRAALAVTFLWAGFGKLLETMPVTGRDAALLADMGVIDSEKHSPSTHADAAQSEKKTGDSKTPTVAEPALVKHSAADFPGEVRVRRVYGIAVILARGATPEAGRLSLVPAKLAEGSWPVWIAWTAAVTELIAGLFALVGLLTRVAAVMLAGTMITAIWLTQIGPAIQSGHAFLGFLPDQPAFGLDAAGNPVLVMLFWQLALLCISLALACTGPGFLSFDRALFPGKAQKDADEED